MEHHFNVDVAKEVGVNAASILNNIVFWVQRNAANGDNLRDGRYWTYNSYEALTEVFPYLSVSQIKTAVNKLVEKGFVVIGDYSENRYKRPNWYSPTDKAMEIYNVSMSENASDHKRKITERQSENNSSNISTDIKPVNKPYIGKDEEKSPKNERREAAKRIVDYLNSTTGQHYRYTDSTLRLIVARLNEGYSEERLRKIINVMIDKWGNDDKMRMYLRPQTLFNATKCETYDQYLPPERKPILAGDIFG